MNTLSIPQPDELLATLVEPAVLLPDDTCDKCGPAVAAGVAVRLFSGGMLTFCKHHYNRYAASLVPLMAGNVTR